MDVTCTVLRHLTTGKESRRLLWQPYNILFTSVYTWIHAWLCCHGNYQINSTIISSTFHYISLCVWVFKEERMECEDIRKSIVMGLKNHVSNNPPHGVFWDTIWKVFWDTIYIYLFMSIYKVCTIMSSEKIRK